MTLTYDYSAPVGLLGNNSKSNWKVISIGFLAVQRCASVQGCACPVLIRTRWKGCPSKFIMDSLCQEEKHCKFLLGRGKQTGIIHTNKETLDIILYLHEETGCCTV